MSTVLPFGNNNIIVYSYEPFSYTISNPNVPLYTLSTSNSSGIPPTYLTIDASRAVIFATSNNVMTPGTQQFTVSALDASLSVVAASTNNVTINPGRFLDASFNSLVGSNYTFYAKEAITPIKLRAPFNLASPVTSSPALPPGLSFSTIDVSSVTIQGTPVTTVPQTNYLIIGRESGSSKVVSSILPIVISNERIQTNITNSGIVSGMQIDSAITPVTLTTIANGTVRYTWAPFPVGIRGTDNSGTTVTPPFAPSDPSKTLIITGTPTLTTAINFINSGYGSNGLTQSIQVDRITPSPLISATVPVTFRFGETVLFDTPSNPTFFTNLPLDPSASYYRANTYFSSNVGISNIFSKNLRSDLSLAFNGLDRAYLFGTPTLPVGASNFTITAINSNLTTRDVSTTITFSNDAVTFPAPVDTCFNFVFSRNVDLSLSGYYPSPITFSANAASGKNIAWSAPALAATGLSLSDTSGASVRIVGTPTTTVPLQNLRVFATSFDTSATAYRDVSFSVSGDVFTLAIPYINNRIVIQNKPIKPIQYTATTLSGNPILDWSATGLLPGLSMSRTGLVTGTSTCNADVTITPTITLSTAYTTSNPPTAAFANVRDVALVTIPTTTLTVPTVFSGAEFLPLAYSGTTDVSMGVSTSRGPWQGSNFTASFSGNYLQGDFSGIALLPKYRVGITGYAGTAFNTWPMDINVGNAPTFVRHILGIDVSGASSTLKLLRNTGPSVALDSTYGYTFSGTNLTWSNASVPSGVLSNVPYGIHDMAQNGNVLVAVLGSNMIRTSNAGATWEQIPSSNIQAVDLSGSVSPSIYTTNPLFGCIATDGTSNWLTLANGWDGSTLYNIVRTSSNNGVNWVDTSVNNFVDINSNTKLYYNNSRYFVLPGDSATNPILYANASNLTTWTAPTMTAGDIFNDLAFSNNTALVVGSNGASSACFSSTDNGTMWTPLPSSPIAYSGSAQINTAGYAYGQWSVAGVGAGGNPAISFSTDLTTWGQSNIAIPGRLTATVEDESSWLWAGTTGGGITTVWNSSGNVDLGYLGWGASTLPAEGSKRIVSTLVSNGTPSLTLSMLYNSTGFAFDSPTQNDYIHWQYIPISPIDIEANSSIAPAEAVYYLITGLPDGLTMTLSPFPTYTATITGTPATYSDAPQRVQLYAVTANSFYVTSKTLGMRTILPTVQKQQSGAGAWTSYLRQYTEVNAATTARDNKATPAIEYRLGEFTSPDPPSVITEQSNCLC